MSKKNWIVDSLSMYSIKFVSKLIQNNDHILLIFKSRIDMKSDNFQDQNFGKCLKLNLLAIIGWMSKEKLGIMFLMFVIKIFLKAYYTTNLKLVNA